ncbi:hypothetical protein GF325_16520, partial [Candidatus Bathyarchaeota archaeon]|nr:hypothetical protein [Candidatus Bathyarchaeota archaeon]
MRLVEKGWMELKEEVIDADKCCQCGNCTAVCDAIRMTVHGPIADSDLCQERPTCKDGLGTCYNLCPRTRDNPISPHLLDSWVNGVSGMLESNPFHHEIQVFAVRAVPRDRFPIIGGAGSIRALLLAGIKEEIIDGIVHSSTLSGVQEVLDTEAELLNDGRQFQLPYAPNNILLDAVSNGYQDLAVIGSGCEIQALRHAQNHPILDFELHELVRLAIGCFCFFKPRPDRLNQLLNGNQDKQEITRIIKEPGSFHYQIEEGGTSRRIRARTFIDASKGTCPSCMDHVGNLADISIGQIDAMVGWDMVIIRSQVGRDVLEAAKKHRFVEVREVHGVIEDLMLEITRNRIKFLSIQEIDIVGPKVKHFWFKSPRILSRYSPGQFIVVWLPGVDFLPMTISAIDQDRFRISVKLVGEGTKMLFEMHEGEEVGIRGPYGTGWDLTGD